jgi:hypothetical protein
MMANNSSPRLGRGKQEVGRRRSATANPSFGGSTLGTSLVDLVGCLTAKEVQAERRD